MNDKLPDKGLQLISVVDKKGKLKLEVSEATVSPPQANEVVIRVEASPISPADVMMMMPGLDPTTAHFEGPANRPQVRAQLPDASLKPLQRRMGIPLAPGLEGAGTVVAAGKNGQHLLGMKVAAMTLGCGMFSQFCTVALSECTALPAGVTPSQAAASFSNPLTALAMIETLAQEGHKALIHTAAASSLGQMLARICLEDNIPLVAVVRRQEQVDLLRKLGVTHICNSEAPDFREQLVQAIAETGATVAFDALGGGDMAHQLLCAMEQANSLTAGPNPYGAWKYKQVYIYGRLDKSPQVLNPSEYGGIWGIGGWAMPPILDKAGAERTAQLRERVMSNLTTTFATRFRREISLADMLQRENMINYSRHATGEKFLLKPHQ